jgi:hypothetical protein
MFSPRQGLSIQRPRHVTVSDIRTDLIALAAPYLHLSGKLTSLSIHPPLVTPDLPRGSTGASRDSLVLQFVAQSGAAPLVFTDQETIKDVRQFSYNIESL